MEKANTNIMPELDLFPRISRVARVMGRLFCRHQLSPVSDRFQHPLDDVFDTPAYTQEALFDADLSGWGYDADGRYMDNDGREI
jgi:hypothetical protein